MLGPLPLLLVGRASCPRQGRGPAPWSGRRRDRSVRSPPRGRRRSTDRPHGADPRREPFEPALLLGVEIHSHAESSRRARRDLVDTEILRPRARGSRHRSTLSSITGPPQRARVDLRQTGKAHATKPLGNRARRPLRQRTAPPWRPGIPAATGRLPGRPAPEVPRRCGVAVLKEGRQRAYSVVLGIKAGRVRPRARRNIVASLQPYKGIFPVAPTPFTASGDLDLDGQRRVIDCMVDQGVDGICILANYSEQFLLTDAERDTLIGLCLDHVAGRVPVIVTCSHFATQVAGRAGPQGRRGGRQDADADAALSRRGPARRRGRHDRAFQPRRRGLRHTDHGAGRAAQRRGAQRPVPGAARPRGAARELCQDRSAAGGRQAAGADRGGPGPRSRGRSTARKASR